MTLILSSNFTKDWVRSTKNLSGSLVETLGWSWPANVLRQLKYIALPLVHKTLWTVETIEYLIWYIETFKFLPSYPFKHITSTYWDIWIWDMQAIHLSHQLWAILLSQLLSSSLYVSHFPENAFVSKLSIQFICLVYF